MDRDLANRDGQVRFTLEPSVQGGERAAAHRRLDRASRGATKQEHGTQSVERAHGLPPFAREALGLVTLRTWSRDALAATSLSMVSSLTPGRMRNRCALHPGEGH